MRPIDGDALMRRVIARYKKMMGTDIGHGMGAIAIMITAATTLDVEPVRHGRWEKDQNQVRGDGEVYDYRCSWCKEPAPVGAYGNRDTFTHYCPNCGAKMDLDGEE